MQNLVCLVLFLFNIVFGVSPGDQEVAYTVYVIAVQEHDVENDHDPQPKLPVDLNESEEEEDARNESVDDLFGFKLHDYAYDGFDPYPLPSCPHINLITPPPEA